MGKKLVHAIANCNDCDFTAQWFLTAREIANRHAKKTGHTVSVETGYAEIINEPRGEAEGADRG